MSASPRYVYRAEGAAHVVFAILGEASVLRVPKDGTARRNDKHTYTHAHRQTET